ncbi:MAG: ABC transporter permease, partial [Blastocatellia bacterium]|nr:ABC transporter permease [Blastocatellia bacterium]
MIPSAFHLIFRDAWRSFKSDKWAVVLAFVSMAIGFATATVALSIVETIFLHPLPYRAPGEIVEISQIERDSGYSYAFTYRFFYDIEKLPGVQAISPLSFSDLILQSDGQSDNEPVVITGVACSASIFEVLKLKPLRGRLFDRTDETAEANAPVALISEELWRSRYGGEPDILGRKIRLNEQPFTVIGIMRAGLQLPPSPSAPAVWIPLGSDPLIAQVKKMFPSFWDRAAYLAPLWARLDSGMNIKAAEERVRTAGLPLLAQDDQLYSPGKDLRITAVEEKIKSKYRVETYVLILAALLTLAVSCFNVS